MRRALIVLSLIGLVTLSGSPAGAIVYGEFDGNLHPYVGTLVVEIDGEKVSICTGTMIAEKVFLTAAHCTAFAEQDLGTNRVWVSFDPVFDPERSRLFAGTTHTNPEWGSGGFSDANDIAVVILDRAPRVGVAQLPTEGLLDQMKASGELDQSTVFTAVGYGTIRETRKTGPQGILDNNQRRFGLQTMNALRPSWLQLSMNEATGDAGTCYGDSGGPHFLGDETSNLIVSITVTGDAMCKATDTTYRLDTASAREFLDDFVTLP